MTQITRRLILVLIASLMLLPLAGCEDKITQENYDKIKLGMALHDVEIIMGGKGEKIDRGGMSISGGGIATGSGQTTQQLYEWRKGNKAISVLTSDGKVVQPGKEGF
jgi:hypothetical protein